jgi:hypothetical protein
MKRNVWWAEPAGGPNSNVKRFDRSAFVMTIGLISHGA